MTTPPPTAAAAVVAVCTLACVAFTYRRSRGDAGGSGGASPSRSASALTGGDARSNRVLALAMTLLVVLSMVANPVAAGLGSAADGRSMPAGTDVDGTAPANHDPGGTNGSVADTSGAAGTDPATTDRSGDATRTSSETESTAGASVATTDRGNTGFQPWYLYTRGVNTANGNLFRSTEDVSIRALGGNLTFVRSYNSHLSAEHGSLGFGWTHNYAMRVEERDDGSVVFVDGDGSRHVFTPSNGGYEPPPGVHERLRAAADGFDLDRLDGTTLHFDTEGVLRWIEDRNGNRATLEYTDGRLTAVRDGSGQRLELTYNDEGRIANVTDPLNRTVEYEYETGDLVSVTDVAGRTTEFDYYENHALRGVREPSGFRTSYTYHDGSDRVRCVDDEVGGDCLESGLVFEYDDANGTVDVRNVLADGTTTVELNDAGNPTGLASANVSVDLTWDDELNLVERTNGTGTYTFDYDQYGNPIEMAGPEGETINWGWRTVDTADRYVSLLMNRTTSRGLTTRYRYDARGNRIAEINPVGETRRMRYDAQGNLVAETDFEGHETTYTYDDHGFRTSTTDPTGRTTNVTYDAAGRPVSETNPRGYTYRFVRDADGNVVKRIDPLGNVTEMQYDDGGRLVSVTDATGRTVDALSRPPTTAGNYRTDGSGTLLSYEVDGMTVSRNVDGGRVTEVTFDYGDFERDIDYRFDDYGRLTAMEGPGGTTTYEHDALGRVVRVVGPSNESVEYAYDADGRRKHVSYSNGVATYYRYDDAGRTRNVTAVGPNGSVVFGHTYTYDAAGNVESVTDAGGNTTHYEYDPLNRLVRVTYPSGRTVSYTYDAVGNRLSRTVNGSDVTTYAYDEANELVRAGDVEYKYDERGNRIERRVDGNVTQYDYGPGGRLTAVTLPDGDRVTFSYLPSGERLSKTTPNGTTYYAYASSDVVAEFHANGSLKRSYTHGPGVDDLVMAERGGDRSFYHQDPRNDVRALTGPNGTKRLKHAYRPFGRRTGGTEPLSTPYGFAGRRYDEETGLYYNRLRYYDPATARFTRPDPLGVGGGVNQYHYASNNPLRFTDPSGLYDRWTGGCTVAKPGGPSGGSILNINLFSSTECSGGLRNPESFQSCDIEATVTELGAFASAELGKATLRTIPITTQGPACGSGLAGTSFWCIGPKAEAKALGGVEVGGGGCVSQGGTARGWQGDAGLTASLGAGAGLSIGRKITITSVDCNCVKVDKPKYENCKQCNRDDCEGEDCDDDPPGNDHPDDTHDPSVLSFDRQVDRSSVPEYRYDPAVAVLDRGFDEEMRAFLNEVNESTYDAVEVGTTNESLARYDVLVVPTGGLLGLASFGPFERKLDRFVEGGGTLVVMPQQRGYQFGPVPGDLRGYGWVEDMSCQFRSVGIDEYCPIVASQDDDVADINVDGYFTEYPENAEIILTRAKNGRPSMLQYGHGNGTVIATTAYTDWASGHHAWNQEGRAVLRDAVTWARGPRNLSTYAPGENVTVDLDTTSYVDLRADRIEVRLYRPEAVFRQPCVPRCGEGFRVYDPERVPPLTANASRGLAALDEREVSVDVPVPRGAQTGIWEVGYALYNDSHGEVQAIRETEQVAVSTFEPSEGGYQRFDSNIELSLASDAEDYARGSNATFTITARNEGDENETVTLWWAFPHNHDGDPGDDALYGASTTGPANADSPLNRTLAVPGGGERTIIYEVPVSADFDRLWLQAHRGTNQSGEYLGRTSRAFFTFEPAVEANVTTDSDRYPAGTNATVTTALRGKGVGNATVRTVVLAPDNTLIGRHEGTVRLTGANVSRANVSGEVRLPTAPQDGHYVVTTEVLDSEDDRVGYDSTTFEIPYEVRVVPSLPATLRSTNRIEFVLENLGASAVGNASLDAALVDPSGTTVWTDSARADVPDDGTTSVAFEDVPVGDLQFGAYELRYATEYGTNRFVRTERLPNNVLATGGFAEPRYRQRETAVANVTLLDEGRFSVETNATLDVPDAGYTARRSVALDPGEGTTLNYAVDLPADVPAGTHEATVTVGSTNPVTRTFEFVVPESELRIDVEQGGVAPGGEVAVTVRNVGGVDTDADCSVAFIDRQGRDLPASDISGTVLAGGNATTTLAVPDQAVSGRYFVEVACTDGNTGETTETTETVDVDGLAANVGLSTDEEIYRPDENVTVTVDLENHGGAIENGTLHVEITDPSVATDGPGGGSDGSTDTSSDSGTDGIDSLDADSNDGSTVAGGDSADGGSTPDDGTGSVDRLTAGTYTSSGSADGDSESTTREFDGISVTPTSREVEGETIWEDETVVLNESLVINGSADLTMRNVTLLFDLEDDGQYGIEVRDNGSLSILQGSTVDSTSYYDYTFEVYPGTEFEVRDSTIRHAWAEGGYGSDPDHPVQRDGIGVATDGAVVENATIEESQDAALAFHGADDARVLDSTFRGNYGDTVLVNASTNVTVVGTTFDDNGDGVVVRDASGNEVRNNNFTSASSGWAVRLDNASATRVRDNRIGLRPGVELLDGSTDGMVSNNTVASDPDSTNFGSTIAVAVRDGANGTTVRGNEISGLSYGISVRANRTTVSDNAVRSTDTFGINVTAGNASLSNNTVSDSGVMGVYLRRAENATLRDNSMDSFHADGSEYTPLPLDNRRNEVTTVPDRRYYTHDIDASNAVGGGPLKYRLDETGGTIRPEGGAVWLVNATDATVTGEGTVGVVRSTGVDLRDLNASTGSYLGPFVGHSNRTTVSNVTATGNEYGVVLFGAVGGANATGTVVERTNVSNSGESGLFARAVADTLIRDTVSRKNTYGLDVRRGRNTTVVGVTVTGTQPYGGAYGIDMGYASNSTVVDSYVRDFREGIRLWNSEYRRQSGNITVSNNTVVGSEERGISLDDAATSTVSDNVVRDQGRYASATGIEIGGENISVLGNDVTRHSTGIAVDYGPGVTVRGNAVTNNTGTGIVASGGPGSVVENNTGSRNEIGIRVGDDDQVLINNDVSGTYLSVEIVASRNATLRGNVLDSGFDIEETIYGEGPAYFEHDIDTTNTIHGDPLAYRSNETGTEIPAGAAQVWITNSTNVTAHGADRARVVYSEGATVRNVTASGEYDGVFVLRSSNTTVRNATVRNSSEPTEAHCDRCGRGIGIRSSSGTSLIDVTSSGNGKSGVRVFESEEAAFEDVTVSNNEGDGIYVETFDAGEFANVTARNNSGTGLYFGGATNTTFTSVDTTENGGGGMELEHRSFSDTLGNNSVEDLVVTNNSGRGLVIRTDGNALSNVTVLARECNGFTCPEENIWIAGEGNRVSNLTSSGSRGYGIDISGDSNTITDSRFSGNSHGVLIHHGRNNTINDTYIVDNRYTGVLLETAQDNLLYNNYIDNPEGDDARETDGDYNDDPSENNSWNVTKRPADGTNIVGGEFIAGNYWGSYAGDDTDGDGIGDTGLPYDVSGELNVGDYRPLVGNDSGGRVVWSRNLSVDVDSGTTETVTLEVPASQLGGDGKRKLGATLTSSSNQTVAVEDPSFYVFESSTTLTLEPDEPIYRTGETATVSGTLTNDGSSERTYDLSVARNGTEIHGESVTLAPGENHTYTVNTTADGPFRLTAEAGNVTVGEIVEVADPRIEATVSAPLRVDRGPFGVTIRLNNTGRVATDLAVGLTPGDDTWNVTLAPGERRLLETNRTVRSDTIYTAEISGDVDRSLTEGVAFAENATVATAPADVYAPGTVEVPYTVENTDTLPTELTATFAVGNRTRERAVYLPTGGTTAGSVAFDLPAGSHTLDVDWPFGNATRTLRVAERDQLDLNTTVPATPTNGTLRTTVELANVGPNAVNGTLRAESPAVSTTRGFDLEPGENDTVTIALAVPEGTAPGRYNLTVTAGTGGDVLAAETDTFETTGPAFELVAGPDLGTYGLGDEVNVTATVVNTGSAGGQVALNATAPGIAESATTAWLGAGERKRMTATIQLPDDLEAGSYDLFYGLDGADRRTSIAVAGAEVDVEASLDRPGYTENDTATLTLTVTNERDIALDPFVRVKFNENETVEPISLNGSETETLSFRVPIRFDGDEKIFYGVYADTGRSLYISGAYPHRARPNVTVSTDEQIYEPGDTATVTVETDREGEVGLSAPGFGWQRTINGTTSTSFEVPPLGSGTYYLHYSFANRSYSYPFDVDGYGVQVRDAALDQGVYRPGDTVGLSLELVPTRNLSGTVTATLRDTNGTAVATERTAVDLETGRNEVTLAPTLPEGTDGPYLVRYRINGSVDARTVLDAQGVKYLEVRAREPDATNRAPVPTVAVSPTDPTAGERVTFDAGASRDPDGRITRYQWDLDDDGVYDETGTRITHTFATAGDYPVTLRVTDDRGATNTTTRTVPVAAPTATPTPSPGAGDGGDDGSGGGGQPGAPHGGDVELTGATLPDDSVTAGQPVLVRVDLANFDPAEGRLTLQLTANGSTVTERTVTVGASTERTVSLRHAFGTAGTYDLAVNGEPVGTVTVTEATTPTPTATRTTTRTPTDAVTPTPTATGAPTPTATATATRTAPPPTPSTPTSDDGPGFGAVAALLAMLALVGGVRLRRRD